ncbi:hypothetical protein GPL21_05880 [Bradyrhizobium pachyrhizi]|uniref:Molecular chaperone GroEL n=1 Tax=Bradyrhizobium pachyrhizi TaxID=280333 RepID=A0A844SMK2_9BRAD|nr:hypothetical protein [Bradyrhizobium pachyrhizi]
MPISRTPHRRAPIELAIARTLVAVVTRLLENENYNWGFNAATGEYQDPVKAGVIDPAKVVRTVLQDGASIVSLLVTTEALVAEKPKRSEADAPATPPMDF